MGAVRKEIDRLLTGFPPEQEEEVLRFVRRLAKEGSPRSAGRPSFRWAGALKATDTEKTSVDLQHEALTSRLGKNGSSS